MRHRRSPNGQRVTPDRRADGVAWWWECDHAHRTVPEGVDWCGKAPTQAEAYQLLDQHNAEHHPHIRKNEDGRWVVEEVDSDDE